MNKQALVELVHGIVGGTKVQAEEVVESIITGITKTLKKGEEVSIAGLGIFLSSGKCTQDSPKRAILFA